MSSRPSVKCTLSQSQPTWPPLSWLLLISWSIHASPVTRRVSAGEPEAASVEVFEWAKRVSAPSARRRET